MALLAVAGLGLIWVGRGPAEGPPHPKRWDASVLPLVRFVERTRGLRFRHPVTVEYLSDDEFRAEVADEPPDGDNAARLDEEATARALGLPVGPNGLAAADATLSGLGTTAFYDDETERVEVRGTEPTVDRRATLVHELTHALQDQHFDISRQGSYASGDRNSAFEAVVEGDAVRIEDAYVESLPQAEQDAYDKGQSAGSAAYEAGIAGVPDWLSATTDAPYSVGGPFVEALDAAGGRRAVDRALRNPPGTQAEIMDAVRYRRGDRPRTVAAPEAPPGDRVVRRDALGALRWLLLLAERIPAADALRAVDGWGGDASVAYEHQGRVCVAAAFEGTRPAAEDEMAGALARWARAMPAGSAATVGRRGAMVELTSCDPGAAALPPQPGSSVTEAMTLLTDRAVASATAAGEGPAPRSRRDVSSRGG